MKLKICGIQSLEEAQRLAEMGVEFIGLNFVSTSSRRIEVVTAQAIAAPLRNLPTKVVALFQNQPLELVNQHVAAIKPDFVQLHGDESDDYIAQVEAPVIKVITPTQYEKNMIPKSAMYYLLDRNEQGTGRAVDTALVKDMISRYPGRIFLAGGITPDNVAELLDEVNPFAIDIAGGVRAQGTLSFAKVARVLEVIRSRR